MRLSLDFGIKKLIETARKKVDGVIQVLYILFWVMMNRKNYQNSSDEYLSLAYYIICKLYLIKNEK